MRKVQKILTGIFLTGVLTGGVGTGIAIVEYSSLAYGGEKVVGEENVVTKNLDFEFQPDGRRLIVTENGIWGRSSRALVEIDDTVPVGIVRYEVSYNERNVTPYLEFEEYEEEEAEIQEDREQSEGWNDSQRPENDSNWETEAEQQVLSEESWEESRQQSGESETGEQARQPAEQEDEKKEESPEKPEYLGYLRLTAEYHDNGFALLMENKDYVLEDLKQGKISSYDVAYITEVKIRVNSQTAPYIKSPLMIR